MDQQKQIVLLHPHLKRRRKKRRRKEKVKRFGKNIFFGKLKILRILLNF